MKPMAGPVFSLDSDKRAVTVAFPKDLPGEIKLNAEQIENLVAPPW